MDFRRIACMIPLGLACVFLTGCVTITISPEWQIRTVDEQGKPVEGAEINQDWEYFGLTESQSEYETSGPDGLVVFRKRTVDTHILFWLTAYIKVLIRSPAHGSYGRYVAVGLGGGKWLGQTTKTNI